jgi:hypothetical protein
MLYAEQGRGVLFGTQNFNKVDEKRFQGSTRDQPPAPCPFCCGVSEIQGHCVGFWNHSKTTKSCVSKSKGGIPAEETMHTCLKEEPIIRQPGHSPPHSRWRWKTRTGLDVFVFAKAKSVTLLLRPSSACFRHWKDSTGDHRVSNSVPVQWSLRGSGLSRGPSRALVPSGRAAILSGFRAEQIRGAAKPRESRNRQASFTATAPLVPSRRKGGGPLAQDAVMGCASWGSGSGTRLRRGVEMSLFHSGVWHSSERAWAADK